MAKTGLHIKQLPHVVKPNCDWSLCVGAGCSIPIFPNWHTLAKSIANEYSLKTPIEKKYLEYLTPEILIQSVYERAKRPDNYADSLAKVLYDNLYKGLSKSDKKLVVKCLTAICPYKTIDWHRYIDIIKQKGGTSSIGIGEFIADSIFITNRPPRTIMTFNAELLFPSLINAFVRTKYQISHKVIDCVTEPISTHYTNRIPYVFCHGLVPIPGSTKSAQKRFNAKDKFFFLENEYLQLANSAYSWQASSFMSSLMNSTVFFVGISFTDPNLRRWLSWLHKSRFESITNMDDSVKDSTSHYWIERLPQNSDDKSWIEASVAHLGIRMIWNNDYSEIVEALKKSIK